MEKDSVPGLAVQAVLEGQLAFCKFLSANDTGETGGHQAGIYIPKPAVKIIFDKHFERGMNHDRWASILWHDGTKTNNRFIYYGKRTRNEYRITQFGRGFEYLNDDHTGDLFVLVKQDEENYLGFILTTDEEIEEFLSAFSMSPVDTGKIISKENETIPSSEISEFEKFFVSLNNCFPPTVIMSESARQIDFFLHDRRSEVISNPDRKLLEWTELEYRLFRYIEDAFYTKKYKQGFNCLEEFIKEANSVLNRRKSRAGKSLEHHLSYIFKENNLDFGEQQITEGKHKPDFLFPGVLEYKNREFPESELTFLAAKTTCKDRWRQILNEADRIPVKHLFTLQQGISGEQLQEMEKHRVVLVVPEPNISSFPKVWQQKILTLQKFIFQLNN